MGSFILPEGPFRFFALDVETANSDPASICQLGLACVRDDGTIRVASTLIDPEQPFADFNVNLHGIGRAQVVGAPKFPTILQQIAPLVEEHVIIQHSTFDRGAINGACRKYGLPAPDWQWADSVQIARRAWPELRGQGGHGLGNLKQVLDLEFEHHDAGEDAKAAALVVLRAEAQTGQSLADMMNPARKVQSGGRRQKPAPVNVSTSDLAPHLEGLTTLINYLSEARPLSRRELEEKWKAARAATGPFDAVVSGPSFLSLPEDEFRTHLRSIDNDLGAQVEIVNTACRVYFDTGDIPAPYYAWRIAIILSKAKEAEHERAFLAAWCRHFGSTSGRRYEDLAERARKRGVEVLSD
ncbi:hypothetical protein GIY56_17040 [Paracoccus sp. YIM 132242]|uniref:Exonuclease domain-containing protein n=2 Tax=Paracoccus lichenicola TaxID=2665644 RepID=A0A6L6HS11_9RHOB|nr:hypothetical protein [Paracoccus lichenicola]